MKSAEMERLEVPRRICPLYPPRVSVENRIIRCHDKGKSKGQGKVGGMGSGLGVRFVTSPKGNVGYNNREKKIMPGAEEYQVNVKYKVMQGQPMGVTLLHRKENGMSQEQEEVKNSLIRKLHRWNENATAGKEQKILRSNNSGSGELKVEHSFTQAELKCWNGIFGK